MEKRRGTCRKKLHHDRKDTMNAPETTSSPGHHSDHLKQMLNDVIQHAREDVKRVEDPRAKALFETTAEVLGGLVTAYDHYEAKEAAWR